MTIGTAHLGTALACLAATSTMVEEWRLNNFLP